MAGIPLSALRRALAEAVAQGGIAHEMGAGLTRSGAALGAPLGAIAQYTNDPDADNLAPGILSGAALGAAGGRGLRVALSAGAGASGLSRGLREALAEAAAERGVGRAALRDSEHADDAMRFHGMGDDSQFYDEAAQTGTPVSELRSRGSFEGFGERFQPQRRGQPDVRQRLEP